MSKNEEAASAFTTSDTQHFDPFHILLGWHKPTLKPRKNTVWSKLGAHIVKDSSQRDVIYRLIVAFADRGPLRKL